MVNISKSRAKFICADWHSGQYSAFYQFASSGVFLLERFNDYMSEIQDIKIRFLLPNTAANISIGYSEIGRIVNLSLLQDMINLEDYFLHQYSLVRSNSLYSVKEVEQLE